MKKIITFILLVLVSIVAANSAESYDFGSLKVTLLNQDPDPANPGEYVELRFNVEKIGNEEMEDISFELVPDYPFSFDASDSPIKELGNWKVQADDSTYYRLYYKLRVDENAIEDTYNLTLIQRANGLESSQKFGVRVDKPRDIEFSVGSVKTNPQQLVPDYDDGSIDIELVNIGEEDAYQVVSTMKLVDGVEESFGYSNRVSLGKIEAGSAKTATFYVDTLENLSAGTHETQLEVKYKDNDNNVVETIEIPFELRVFGKPQYNVIFSNVTSNLVGGESGKISLRLENIGEQDADLVSLQVFKDSTQPFSFDERSDFIGKLDQNAQGDAVFTFDVDESAPAKEYRLTLQIRSVVDGDVFVEEKDLIIPIENGEKSGSMTPLFILFSVLIGIVVGYFIGKKRINNKSKK